MDLLIKKLTHAPDTAAPQPYIEAAKTFMMSANPLHVEARLDKEVRPLWSLRTGLKCGPSGLDYTVVLRDWITVWSLGTGLHCGP